MGMTDRPQLLAGLLARRKELVQEISATEALLRHRYSILESLDHLIGLEDEEVELPAIPFSPRPGRKVISTLPYGDVSKLCLEALREAGGKVLSTRQIVDYAIRAREVTFASQKHRESFSSSVAMALRRCRRRGLILKVGTTTNGQGQWAAKTD